MARFDLNLLSALDALLTDRNVTRASERLNVTQPTMSGMLQRLRYQFDDQLLVRNGRHLELTPFGESLVEPVREALRGVELLMLAEPVFDPPSSTRTFTLMASDYCTVVFLPDVVARVAAEAPGTRVVIQPLATPIERMLNNEIDLCITADDLSLFGHANCGDKIHSETLFSDEFVCVVAEDHPLDEQAGIEEMLSYLHIGVEMAGAIGTIETVALRQHTPLYKPNVVVADFFMVPCMVARSDLVGIIPARLADQATRTQPIRSFRPPFHLPTLNEAMLWHSRHLQDPAHVWLREVIRDVAARWTEAPAGFHRRPSPANHRREELQAVR